MNGDCGSGDSTLPTQADESPSVQNENTQPIGISESDAQQQLEFENKLLREQLQEKESRVEELEIINRLLRRLSQHWFHSQEFVVCEEADTPRNQEVGEVLDLPTQNELNQNSGEDLMVSNGQEMVQASMNEEPVIMECQLCSDPFGGNHVYQVTHCHICDRFRDHGPYDALPHRVNWDPTITVH